jgi:hypothetical protein
MINQPERVIQQPIVDARTVDVPRMLKTVYQCPAPSGSVNPRCMYDKWLDKYKAGPFESLADVNTGSVQYYVDSSIAHPLSEPNFARTPVEIIVAESPNGVAQREYRRTFSCPRMCCESQFLHDTTEFREDLMVHQMRKMNEQNWSYCHGLLL